MSGTIFSVCSTSAISALPAASKRCRKRTQEGAGEEGVTAKSRSMMNLVTRCRVGDSTVLVSIASENPGNTKSESQKVPLSSLNVQLTGTGKPATLASSSNSSEWNNDDKWSSQVRKSGEMSKTSTVRPVSDKLVIDIDMDSDTATESDLSLKSRSFTNRVNDRLRKMLNRAPEDSMQDIDKCSMTWEMFMSSTVEASVFKNTGRISAGATENSPCSENLNISSWSGRPRNVWNDIVSWQKRRLNNSTKYQLHALMTIISKKKNWNPWEICQKCVLKLFWDAYTWHVLQDPIFHGQWTNLHEQSPNGPKLVTNAYRSSKRSRYLVWWEDTTWKTLWRTFFWTNYPVWFIGWVSPYLADSKPSRKQRKPTCSVLWSSGRNS